MYIPRLRPEYNEDDQVSTLIRTIALVISEEVSMFDIPLHLDGQILHSEGMVQPLRSYVAMRNVYSYSHFVKGELKHPLGTQSAYITCSPDVYYARGTDAWQARNHDRTRV